MKIIALMLLRNEDWIIEASLDAAMRWCDGAAVYVDRTDDDTLKISQKILRNSEKPYILRDENLRDEHWNEMHIRQMNLEDGRRLGGTHFAIIDGDEILTHNNLKCVRSWFENLKPAECLDVPMITMRGLNDYQTDDSVWSRAKITLGFRDERNLSHRPRGDGYQHHNRPPFGSRNDRSTPEVSSGGVMHLQFANRRRLLAKHVLYRMVDHIRWPEQLSPKRLNQKYDEALKKPVLLTEVPKEFWGDYMKSFIDINGDPYQDQMILGMLDRYGLKAFDGLDLKGYEDHGN